MTRKSTPPWILVLFLFVSFIIVADGGSSDMMISIDCGASRDYVDETTGIWYQTDQHFIETGISNGISPDLKYRFRKVYKGQQLEMVRSFPEGDRNCYTLQPKHLNNNNNKKYNYLIRAVFAYGNYDNKNQPPSFDLYLGPNFWDTVRVPNGTFCQYYEIIHVPMDILQVCLVNTGQGTPFISALELRLLNHSLYSISLPLSLQVRIDVGTGLVPALTRYKDDVYDRVWLFYDFDRYYHLNTSAEIGAQDSIYKLSSEILSTAAQAHNSSIPLSLDWFYDASYEYYVFLHFAEIQKLPTHHRRIINVTFDDINFISQPLEYLKPVTVVSSKIASNNGNVRFTVRAASESDAPPILNAFEIYRYTPLPNSPTNAQDVSAVIEIKRTYGISRINWQGDPCIPSNLRWEGLSCSSDNNSRIISLNLSSSKLTGQIATSFANLKTLESLDLSNNELIGQVPAFLADLPNLKVLNLTGNKLTGSIPKALREKADLQLSVARNPGLCQKDSCKENKFVIPLVASLAVLVLIIILSLMIWRLRKKRQVLSTKSRKMGILKQKNREFSYSQVLRITDNFKTIIGEGGFGKVYLGTLEDDVTQVAVKLLSPSSKQGYKEFESEAQLLSVIHHRNLVSLIGYCHENDIKALIYEYMDNGDLGQLLSEKNPNVLKWNERLQVATDAAKGLEYLHNGCKTPIIHRDLKPSNILLHKSKLAKIADFGLSRAFTNEIDSHLSTQPAGTPGYIDPEFQRSGNLNKKSDIYSFGMILLQLITGHPPIKKGPENISFILDWVQPKIECGDIEGIVDPTLAGEFGVSSTWKAVEVAMSCILPTPTQRPEISYVLQELQECLALEMDHPRINTTTSDSLHHTVNCESITILSARSLNTIEPHLITFLKEATYKWWNDSKISY